jgi:class 3 adenylate cyclase
VVLASGVHLGGAAVRAVLAAIHATVRGWLGRYRGTEIDTAGDGFFATFDGPARAAKCASAIVHAVRPLGIEVRADKMGGMAVVIGARIGATAGASEVLASQTVRELTVGSGLQFSDAGEHELKGVPNRWRLYRVVS